jgi:sensor histidine kinase YesM
VLRRRIGIRGKLLGFYGATLVLVLALEVLAQNAALRAGKEFEARLARYHAVQGLRTALADFRSLAERYLRERLPEQYDRLQGSAEGIAGMVARLAPLADESQDAYFEERAVRRGVEAWLPAVLDSLSRRQRGLPDAYQAYVAADRLAGYVDGYLGKLLSISMATGSSRYKEIVARGEDSRRLALAGILGAGALALGLSALFASSLTAPIRRLAEAADRMASGDLAVEPVEAATGDEVEVLARAFTAMSANIRALVEGLEEKAELERLLHAETLSRVSMGRALREAQFMNLQDQIRPHFLFNALNTIARNALFEGAPETERLARSLGKLLRYSLSEGRGFVSIGEELETLREYLSFQGIRFGQRLAWEIRSEPDIEGVPIPRFTLQPIVENAVRHGIEPKEEGGKVIVSARRLRDRVRLVVADSGAGMDGQLLKRIRAAAAGQGLPPPTDSTLHGEGLPGIGLANLETRLAYRYGVGVSLSVSSRRGRGTIVRISLPASGAAAEGADAV